MRLSFDSIRDGASLRVRLLPLVILSLLATGLAGANAVGDRVSTVQAVTHANNDIRNAAAVGAVRRAFEQEMLPGFVLGTMASSKPKDGVITAQYRALAARLIGELRSLQANTDAALGALAKHAATVAIAQQLGPQLIAMRRLAQDPTPRSDPLTAALALMRAMAVAEASQIEAATTAGLNRAEVLALRAVDVTARAAQAAAEQFNTFGVAIIGRDGAEGLQRWVQSWGTYTAAADAVLTEATPATMARWKAANAEPLVANLNTFLNAAVTSSKPVNATGVLELTEKESARNQAYGGVLASAVDDALAAGHAQRTAALTDLIRVIIVLVLLALLSLAAGFLIRRAVARALSRLAQDANRISAGDLVDVSVSGPTEVRAVARALSSSVAGLRNIQAQATAVAEGDLNSPVLQQALPGPLGEVVHSSVGRIIRAINEREVAQQELAHRAAYDTLTELPNRAEAIVRIEQALHRAQRSGAQTGVMFVDLDSFKAVNDNFGHAAGDEVLRTVAGRMRDTVREGDNVARLGGDEFIVLVEDAKDEADLVALAHRIIESLSAAMFIEQRALHIGASIGLAFCRDSYVNADRLLQEADAAAYRAKSAGRGRVEIFDDQLRSELSARVELERAIGAGLVNGEFVLYYQPVIDLLTGTTHGVEALIRWRRPGHGLVAPDDFIPIAEQSSLINDIGRWVLTEATAQLATWHATQPCTVAMNVAVNISGRHLASAQLVPDVRTALRDSGIDPRFLVIEVTETVLVDDPIATRNMQALRDLGVQISIDDFGTGYTSIGQLPKLPVDTLKIDRSFAASDDPARQELVRLIVGAAHAFGLSVVAEGIEEQSQADRLRAADVGSAQGFLYARPQLPTELFNDLTAIPASEDGTHARITSVEPHRQLHSAQPPTTTDFGFVPRGA